MDILVNILVGCVAIAVIWAVPSLLLAFVIKKIVRKKLSKGWCVFISGIALFLCCYLEAFLIGVHTPGIIDLIIRILGLSCVFIVLYDENIVSILDTEKEIIKKTQRQKHLNKLSPYSCMLNIIDEYTDKYNCLPFSKISEELKLNLSKTIKPIDENNAYYNSDKSINITAIEQSVVQFLLQYIDAKLISGQFHFYRGALDDNGRLLLKLYKQLLLELIRLEVRDEDTKEIIDANWVNRNYNSLCEDIRSVG